MKKIIFLTFIAGLISCGGYKNMEEKKVTYNDKYINYYVIHHENINKTSENLIIYIDGSSFDSVLGVKDLTGFKSVGLAFKLYEHNFKNTDILTPENTFFMEKFKSHKSARKVLENYTFDMRVLSAKLSIDDYLVNKNYKKIILMGASEGAMILGKIYQTLESRKKITHLFIESNGGLSQYDNFKQLQQSNLPMDPSYKKGLMELDEKIKEIAKDPESIDKWWLGWPFNRWSGFLKYTPATDIINIDIPIIVIHGDMDTNSSVEGSRFLYKEFMKNGKKNLSYTEYKGYDHIFNGNFDIIYKEIEKILY